MSIRLQRIFGILLACLVFSPSKIQAAPGNLDFNFGIQGLVLTDTHDILTGNPGIGAAVAVAIHPAGDPNEGKILGVGFTQTSGYDFSLARYNSDGSLDTSFGTNGAVETHLDEVDILQAVLILPPGDPNAGKILAAGTSGDLSAQDFALARYCADGQLDDGAHCGAEGFGSGGMVTTDFGGDDSRVLSLALQSDGKILAAGYSNASGTRDFALARYNSDGSLDDTFNPTGPLPGTVVTDFSSGEDEANGIAVYPVGDPNEGKILLGGFATDGDEDLALARYCADGNLDEGNCGGSAFSPNGKRVFNTGVSDQLNGLAIQADGKAVGAGFSNSGSDDDFLLLRLCGDGNLDDGAHCGTEGFGVSGLVIWDASAGSQDQANAVALQADGKILAAGVSDAAGFGEDFALARFGTDGNLDFGFGAAGFVLQDFSCLCSDSVARSMALQSDGKILLSGASDANPSSAFNNFAFARFFGDTVEPSTPTADLSVALSADPADPQDGDLVTFTVTVTNQGPDSVSEVVLSNLLLGTFSGLAVDSEACTLGQGAVSCALGSLANGASATVNLTLKLSSLPFSVVATVSGSLIDSNNADNQAVLSFGEVPGGGDGGCRLNVAPTVSWNPAWLGLFLAGMLLARVRRQRKSLSS